MNSAPFPADCAERFEARELIGAGGFGSVWLAIQRNLCRPVAIKLLHASVLTDQTQVARFRNEAQITATLSHPNIVVILDYGAAAGVPWIAYEYVRGDSLRKRLENGALPWVESFEIGMQVASALEAAHTRGVLHRDIKPDNILQSTSELVKVSDFGVARWKHQTGLTAPGTIIGSPAYLSPVQIAGAPADPHSDLYALGITLFELISGAPPFTDPNPMEVLTQQLMRPIPRLGDRMKSLPPAVDRIIQRACAKSREERFESATALYEALDMGLRESRGHSTGPFAEPRRTARGAGAAPQQTQVHRANPGPPERIRTVVWSADGRRKRWHWAGMVLVLCLMGSICWFFKISTAKVEELERIEHLTLNDLPAEANAAGVALLERYPHCARAHTWLGLASHSLGQRQRSEDLFKAALAEDPGDDVAVFYYISVMTQTDRMEEAERLSRAVLDRHPTSSFAKGARAEVLWAWGARDDAIKTLQGAVAGPAPPAILTYTLASYYVSNGDLKTAQTYLMQAIGSAPWMASPAVEQARLLVQVGRWDEAIEICHRFTGPGAPPLSLVSRQVLRMRHIEALLGLGRTREALDALKTALKDDRTWDWGGRQRDQLLFPRWMQCESILSESTGKGDERERIGQLRRACSLNLGNRKETWRSWVELGKALEHSINARTSFELPASLRRPSEMTETEDRDAAVDGSFRMILPGKQLLTPELFSDALAILTQHPAEGEYWLLLGGVLVSEGLLAEAQILFGEALRRLPRHRLPGDVDLLWRSLAWALVMVPDHDIEREWPVWVLHAASGQTQPWVQLRLALIERDRELVIRMLESAIRVPATESWAAIILWRIIGGDPASRQHGELVWSRLLAKSYYSRDISAEICSVQLAAGHVEEARRCLAKFPGDLEMTLNFNLATDLEAEKKLDLAGDLCGYVQKVVRLHLERGDVREAEQVFEQCFSESPQLAGLRLIMDLAATGSPVAMERLRSQHYPPAEVIPVAAESWCLSKDPAPMETLFQQSPPAERYFRVWRALWLSRRGRIRESLSELEHYFGPYAGPPGEQVEICEIVSRPRWIQMLKCPVEPEVLAKADHLLDEYVRRTKTPYLRAIRAGDAAGAEQIAAANHELAPNNVYWSLALAHAVASKGDTSSTQATIESLRVTARWFERLWLLPFLAKPFGPTSSLYQHMDNISGGLGTHRTR